jgi:tripartite-type tricarboxylate transporter receptor subunit TctC
MLQKKRWERILWGVVIFSMGLGLPGPVPAETFPSKTIQLIIPWAPGGGADAMGRLFAEKSDEFLGQKMVVENKPGGGAVIGTNIIAKAKADGYTLGLTGGTLTIHKAIGTDMPYDPMKDLTFISRIVTTPNVILVRADSPWNTLEKLIEYGKKNPGKLNYGTSGIGSSLHLGGELLQFAAGMKMNHVPYKGAAPAVMALLGGHIDLMFSNTVDSLAQIKAGKLIPLAITTPERSPFLPEIPSVVEKGYPNAHITNFFGIFGPAGLPRPVVDKIAGYFKKVVSLPDIQEKLKKLAVTAAYQSPEEFDKFLRDDYIRMAELAKRANIHVKTMP